MATRSYERVHWCPVLMVILMVAGTSIVFLIAGLRKDVSPYMPFISETGANPPEAGIFSIILYFSAVFGMTIIVMRFMVIEECHQGLNKVIGIINKISLPIGLISMTGMIIVAAYPMITVIDAHMTGAFILFIGSLIYAILQTIISYQLHPSHNTTLIFGLRVAIVVMSLASFLIMSFVSGSAFRQWRSANHSHWTGSKNPDDKGFKSLTIAASAEWLMMYFFLAFFLTFIAEFKNTSIHIGLQMTVGHFDDDDEDRRRRYTGSI